MKKFFLRPQGGDIRPVFSDIRDTDPGFTPACSESWGGIDDGTEV